MRTALPDGITVRLWSRLSAVRARARVNRHVDGRPPTPYGHGWRTLGGCWAAFARGLYRI